MERRWLPFNALRAFEAVGRHGSFTAAANALLVSQSAVSRHVLGLEDMLGIQLFDRTPQQPVPTEAGRLLLPVVERAFDRIDAALEEVRREGGGRKRSLRILLPTTFAQRLAVPILRDVRREFPDLSLEIDSRPVPGEAERDADIAVVYSLPRVAPQVLDLLWTVRLTVLCHPAVAARLPEGEPGASLAGSITGSIAGFLAANELIHVRLEGRPPGFLWETFARTAGLPGVRLGSGLVFDTAQLAVQYALSGEGLALVDPMLFQDEIAAGRLVAPLGIFVDDGYGYYLSIDPDDLARPEIALFRSWMIHQFSRLSSRPDALARAEPTTR
jgi:DNA-binding transcriptional LysR family regulator